MNFFPVKTTVTAAELGTRDICRDSVTMFSSQKIVAYCIMTPFVVTTRLLHLDRYGTVPKETLKLFVILPDTEALKNTHPRIVVVAKLKIVACPALILLYLSHDLVVVWQLPLLHGLHVSQNNFHPEQGRCHVDKLLENLCCVNLTVNFGSDSGIGPICHCYKENFRSRRSNLATLNCSVK